LGGDATKTDEKTSGKNQHWTDDDRLRRIREMFLAEWWPTVRMAAGRADDARRHSVAYGTVGIQAALVLNGGALGALPATIGALTSAPRAELAYSAIPFVLGILAAGISVLFAYLNFEWHAQLEDLRADNGARSIEHMYYGAPANLVDTTAKSKWYESAIERSQITSVVCAILGFLSFIAGAGLFISIVLGSHS